MAKHRAAGIPAGEYRPRGGQPKHRAFVEGDVVLAYPADNISTEIILKVEKVIPGQMVKGTNAAQLWDRREYFVPTSRLILVPGMKTTY